MKFVELNRRFRNITEQELEHPEMLAAFGEQLYSSETDDREKLLESRRVVLLAEAGSGKTEEMKHLSVQLKEQGKHAFYADLASLDRESLSVFLSVDDEYAFSAWKEEHDTPAWFFLDSVDELKLTQGKLQRALKHFVKDIIRLLDRTHVIISCRPSDWKFDLDLKTVQELLPVSSAAPDSTDLTGEELFLAPFRRDEERQKENQPADEKDAVRTVVMLPLTRRQIETYARSCGVQDAEAFMEEIRQQEAWNFANRPLDCENLVRIWNAKGKLGTRVEQHEANITAKLKDDPERPDNNLLTPEEAREGAERLSLALALTRTRTLLAPGHEAAAEDVLDSAAILTDWTAAKRNALLRRGLFDPATYGRVRFHHRSVEEYLAACRLKRLREKGLSINALKRFFFAEQYGAEVVIPSMRPIAAWLALWNDEIRWELIRQEPEVLLAYGDPGSLSREDRAKLLRGFAAAYGDGRWRGIDAPSIGEVQRLACPELAPVIRELWEKHSASEEVSYLLLRLIWQGAIKDCADIAEDVAYDVQRPEHQRSIAVSGLVACKSSTVLRNIAGSLFAEQGKWPDKIVPKLAQQLFPAALAVQELVVLIERTPEPRSVTSGFSWYLERIAEEIEPSSSTAVKLRKAVAELIWQGRNKHQEGYWNITGKYSYLSSGLAILCGKQFAEKLPNDDLIWACAVANRFKTRPNEGEKVSLQELKEHFKNNQELRERAFWIEIELMSSLMQQEKNSFSQFCSVVENSLLGHVYSDIVVDDRIWLLNVLGDQFAYLINREIAYEYLFQLWNLNGRLENEAEQLRQAVADDASLLEKVKQDTTPKPKNEAKWERQKRRRECVRKGRERQLVEKWQKWRLELLAYPEAAFSSQKRVSSTLYNLYHWLKIHTKQHSLSKIWNKDALAQAFNETVACRAASACKETWRKETPVLWSIRPADKRNEYLYVWHYGLFGLAEEASSPGWAKRLNAEEAERAAAYATIEQDGFTPWLADLATAHPKAVESVFGDEIDRELLLAADESYLPVLNAVSCHTDRSIKQLLKSRLRAALLRWDSTLSEKNSCGHLNQAIRVLDETAEADERAVLAAECAARFSKEPNGPLTLSWLAGLFRFDFVQGVDSLEQGLNAVKESERTKLAVHFFAGLSEQYSSSFFAFSALDDQNVRANALKSLLQCAYTYIRPKEDNFHNEGSWTPDARDDAQAVRRQLLDALLETSGAEAHKIILELADDPLFAHFPDRLRFRAREKAAKDAEFAPYLPDALVTLEKKFEVPPRSRDELFDVMIDRLEDIQHDIAHHDFNIRQTLRSITDEEEIQRYLAKEFDVKANGAYTVVRENDKADKKRTDIQLNAVYGEQKAVIEIKLAIKDRWTIADFQCALRHQLVGQYLRHESCKAGCLLLTCNGSKSYWKHPETKEHLCFSNLIKLLQDEAKAIEKEKNYKICLAVFGLDLTDPHLEPAHK